jgi:hypothetical protein
MSQIKNSLILKVDNFFNYNNISYEYNNVMSIT